MQLMDPIFELMAPATVAGGFRWAYSEDADPKRSKIGAYGTLEPKRPKLVLEPWNPRDTSQFFFNGSLVISKHLTK